MEFDPKASFNDNLARFRAECERLDPECSKIMFDNFAILLREGDTRQAVQDFNNAVLAALMALP